MVAKLSQAQQSVGSTQLEARVCPACKRPSQTPGEQFCPHDGAIFISAADLRSAQTDPLLGRRIESFAIVARLGEGGMGTVYRALQIGMDREVALKVLRSDLAHDGRVVQRFHQEARAAARLSHRHLATVYTSGSTNDGIYYIAMEHLDGPSLQQIIERSWQTIGGTAHYTIDRPRALRLFAQIVAALAHAHRLGIVHRDLKPENVLVVVDSEDGEQAKVVDFGIAKILENSSPLSDSLRTDSHANLGTALYMAPERFEGAPGDPRMDVYALGLLLHELLSGLLPFAKRYEDREDGTALLHRRFTEPAPPLLLSQPISAPFQQLLSQMLDRDAVRRPAHAGIVRDRLRDIPEFQAISSTLPERSGQLVVPTGSFMTAAEGQTTSTSVSAVHISLRKRILPLLILILIPILAALALLLLRQH